MSRGLGVVFIAFTLAVPAELKAQDCTGLTTGVSNKLASYVAERYEFAPDMTIEDKGLIGGTCYRMLTFHVAAPSRSLTLYLSPDQRFLTPELLDVAVEPGTERRRSAIRTQTELLADQSPVYGTKNAVVTIVEFSDFQCLFCKQFSGFLSDLGPDKDKVRVVFKHFPLPNHSWARRAALASICADSQGDEGFWRIHDFFFLNQSDLSPDSFDQQVATFIKNSGLSADQFRTCMNGPGAEGVLRRDELLAQRYRIDGTPIIFINGRRTVGFKSGAELRAAVSMALAASNDHVKRQGAPGGN